MGQAQLIGSADTYGRRYTTCSITGVVAQSDDDGTVAGGVEAETGSRQREALPPCPECQKQESVIIGKQEYGGGLLCWKNKGGCGHSWPTEKYPMVEKPAAKATTTKPRGKLTQSKDPNDAASAYSVTMAKILNFHGDPDQYSGFRNKVLAWMDEQPDAITADQRKAIEKALHAREDELTALPM